jgi:putative salt-induced outer membrane protein YdiY
MRRSIWVVPALLICARIAFADIITLNNGDQITGTIDELNPKSVVITTPYAGKLTIDRTAVKTMRSEKTVNVVRDSGQTDERFLSPAAENKGWNETTAYVPPPPPPPPPGAEPPRHTYWLSISPDWKNQFSIGVMNTTGNDNTTSVIGDITLHYLKKPDEFTLKLDGAYGLSNGTQTAGLFSEDAVFRHTFSEKLYAYIDDDVRYDAIKGISLQATATGGLGVWVYHDDKLKIDARGGPGITYLKTFDGNENTGLAVEAGFRAEYIFNDRVSASEDALYTLDATDVSIWRIHSETAMNFKIDIERGLGFKLAFDDDYENRPSTGRKNNDTRLTLAMTLDF